MSKPIITDVEDNPSDLSIVPAASGEVLNAMVNIQKNSAEVSGHILSVTSTQLSNNTELRNSINQKFDGLIDKLSNVDLEGEAMKKDQSVVDVISSLAAQMASIYTYKNSALVDASKSTLEDTKNQMKIVEETSNTLHNQVKKEIDTAVYAAEKKLEITSKAAATQHDIIVQRQTKELEMQKKTVEQNLDLAKKSEEQRLELEKKQEEQRLAQEEKKLNFQKKKDEQAIEQLIKQSEAQNSVALKAIETARQQEKQKLETEESKHNLEVQKISRMKLTEIEMKAKLATEEERSLAAKMKIEFDAKEKTIDLELKKASKEVEILDKKTAIQFREQKAEFDAQVEIYQQLLKEAHERIRAHKGSKYTLNYDPPKIIEENGKKKVVPGYVKYNLS